MVGIQQINPTVEKRVSELRNLETLELRSCSRTS
jgi:hypothetical protein